MHAVPKLLNQRGWTVCAIRVGELKMLWVITGNELSQYGLSQV